MNLETKSQNQFSRNNVDFLTAELDGELILMHMTSGGYFGMDKTTTQIWHLLEEPKTIVALANDLTEKFNVEQEQCIRDIEPVLKNMVERSFLNILL